jgi:hypothetical protein
LTKQKKNRPLKQSDVEKYTSHRLFPDFIGLYYQLYQCFSGAEKTLGFAFFHSPQKQGVCADSELLLIESSIFCVNGLKWLQAASIGTGFSQDSFALDLHISCLMLASC